MLNEFLLGRLSNGSHDFLEKQSWSDAVPKEKSTPFFENAKEYRHLSYVNYDLVEKHHGMKLDEE